MSTEINLLKNRVRAKSSFLTQVLALRAFSLTFLFVVSFSSIILFILVALSPLPDLQEQEKEEIKKLSLFQSRMAKVLFTKERVGHIHTLLQTRPVYAETLQSLEEQLPNEASVDTLHLDKKTVTVSVSSSSLGTLDQFAKDIMKLQTEKKRFSKITLSSLYLNPDNGRYVLDMELLML